MFDDVRVPVENRVGGEGEGFRIAMMGLDGGRLNIGACSLGGAQRCLDEAVKYTKERKQFGTAIADFQNTQFMLADMATELEAARALLYIAAAKVTANAPDKTQVRGHGQAARDRYRIVGRRPRAAASWRLWLSEDYPIERFWRDLRVHSILEGTNQIMRMIVGRDLTRANDRRNVIDRRRRAQAGRIRLNRPKAIHALTTAMCAAMIDALRAWRDDPEVEAVLIDHAEGRGFCAGGDIRMLARKRREATASRRARSSTPNIG